MLERREELGRRDPALGARSWVVAAGLVGSADGALLGGGALRAGRAAAGVVAALAA